MKVAIIGSIGSGKSKVVERLKQLDRNVFDCDIIAKEIMQREEVKERISIEFGVGLDKNGELVKNELSDIIFADEIKRKHLEEIVHTLVLEELVKISADYEDIFVEVSAYKGSCVEGFFDVVIGVIADMETRIGRVIERSGYTREKILSIIDAQPSDQQIRQMSNYVIENNSSIEVLNKRVEDILEKIYSGIDDPEIIF